MTILAQIQTVLDDHLQTFATAQGLGVEWENTPGNRDLTPTYLTTRMSALVKQIRGVTRYGTAQWTGNYQINLNTPSNGGTGALNALADLLVEHFAPGAPGLTTTGGNRVIIENSYPTPSLNGSDYVTKPIIVSWICLANTP